LLFGSGGKGLMFWEWASMILALAALLFLINPGMRRNERILVFCCAALFVSIWIEKGLAMIIAGFVPSPLGRFTPYCPTIPELLISAGIYGIGALLITVFFRIFIKIKMAADEADS
ncbi:MAG: menaquinol oxidoreductase, partial [Acidobacteria bacterium]|nr:menaquinol oxidoreductase [Acidobacteriota bacterium]